MWSRWLEFHPHPSRPHTTTTTDARTLPFFHLVCQKVRHVERMKSRGHTTGRRSNEEHQRYLMIQKKRFEAVVTDSLNGASVETDGDEEEAREPPASDPIPA